MANNVKYSFQISADAAQAQKTLDELNQSLNKLQKMAYIDMSFDKDILQAADAAKVLQRELTAATNIKTGKLDMVEFASGLRAAGTSVDDLSQKLLQAGKIGQQAFQGMVSTLSAADVPIKKMNATLSNALTTLKNTIKWEASSTIVHGLEGAFSSAVSYAKNLNTSLTNIRIVTGQTIDDMAKFTVSANKAAKELSTTTKAYADAALIYYQQGDSSEEVAKKAAITIKAANAAANTSAAEMSEYLTAVWNSYQVGADELERYVDIMAALGAKTATSLEEIATSMQKVAATGNTVGVSMEQVSSIIATVSSVTRESAESIGTSYKTIFARMGDLKLGETDEDGVGLGQVSSALESIGVQVLDAQGQLRDMGDIVTDLGDKWQTMNGAQKTAIAQVVAGKRQYTQLMALFENWDMYKDNMAIAGDAEGSLQNMADIYAESWEGASARVKAATEGIYGQLINDQSMIKMTNSFANMLGGIEGVIKGMGGLGGVLTHFGAIASTVFRSKIAQSVDTTVEKLVNFKNSFQGKKGFGEILKSAFGETTGLRQYKAELKELQGQLGTITAGGSNKEQDIFKAGVLQDIISSKEKLLELESKMTPLEKQRAQTSIDSLNKELSNVDNLSTEWEDYNKSLQKSMNSITSITEQYKAFKNVSKEDANADNIKSKMQKRIHSMFNLKSVSVSAMFNNQTLFGKDVGKDSSLDKLIKRYKDLNVVSSAASGAVGDLDNIFKSIKGLNTAASKNSTELQPVLDVLNNLKTVLNKNNLPTTWLDELIHNIKTSDDTTENVLKQLKQELDSVWESTSRMSGKAAVTLEKSLGISSDKLLEIAQKAGLSSEALAKLAQAMKNVENNAEKLNDNLNTKGKKSFGEYFADFTSGAMNAMSSFNSFSSLVENWDSGDISDKIGSFTDSLLEFGTALASGNMAAAVGTGIGTAAGIIVGLIDKHNKELAERIADTNQVIQTSTEELKTSAEAAKQAYDNYKAADEARQSHEIDSAQFISSVDSVLTALGLESEMVKALAGDYDGLKQSIKSAYKASLAEEKQKAINLLNTGYRTLEESLDSYNGDGAVKNGPKKRNDLNFDIKDFQSGGLTAEILRSLGFESKYNMKLVSKIIGEDEELPTTQWGWKGTQADIPQLRDQWEKLSVDQEYEAFRNTEAFYILQDWMEQFQAQFQADDTFMQLASQEALSNISEQDLIKNGENIYDYVIDSILLSFGNNTPDQATDLQRETAQKFANQWIRGFNNEIQTAFFAQSSIIDNTSAAADYAKLYSTATQKKVTVSDTATLPIEFLMLDYNNQLVNGISSEIYNQVQEYQTLLSARKAAANGTDNLASIITMSGIDPSKIGINLTGEQSLTDYLNTATDSYKETIRLNLIKELELAGTALETALGQDQQGVLFKEAETFKVKQQQDINQYVDTMTYSLSQNFGLSSAAKEELRLQTQSQQGFSEIKKIWNQLETDSTGKVTLKSNKNLALISTLSEVQQQLFLELMKIDSEGTFDIDTIFGDNSVLSTMFNNVKLFTEWYNTAFGNLVSGITDTGSEKTNKDFNALMALDADTSGWSDNERKIVEQYARNYGIDPTTWKTMDDQAYADSIYTLVSQAFNEKYKDVNLQDPKVKAAYDEDLTTLSRFKTNAVSEKIAELKDQFDFDTGLLDTIDLTGPLDASTDSAKLLIETLQQTDKAFNIEQFNALSPKQKELKLLEAQVKLRKSYLNNVKQEYNLWLASADVAKALQGEDPATLEKQREYKLEIAQATQDVADATNNVNIAYSNINDEIVAGLAAKWEKVNQEIQKYIEQANILKEAIGRGDLSAEEARKIGKTESEWSQKSAQERAKEAAKAEMASFTLQTQGLTKQQNTLSTTINYLTKYREAWKGYVDDKDEFERQINMSYLAGDFGAVGSDEAIKAFEKFRNAYRTAIEEGFTGEGILIRMSDILQIDQNEIGEQLEQLKTSAQDSLSDIYSNLNTELQSAAQESVDTWTSAFESIAEARDSLLQGKDEDLWKQIAGDPAELKNLYDRYNEGRAEDKKISIAEFADQIFSGLITEDDIPLPTLDQEYYNNKYAAAGLPQRETFKDTFEEDKQRIESEIISNLTNEQKQQYEANPEMLLEAQEDYYRAIANATKQFSEQEVDTLIADLFGTDVTKQDIAYAQLQSAVEIQQDLIKYAEQGKYSDQVRQETLSATEFAGNVENLTINTDGQIKTIDKNGQEVWQDTGLTRQDGQIASYEEWTQLQGAIDRAQEAKYAGGSWESLSEEDRQLLDQYGIDFSNVDTAAASCASALSACAAAASALAQAAAGAGGYTEINGEWGKQTTYTDEQGKAVYGDQWELIKQSDRWTANKDGSYTSTWNKDNEMTNLMNQVNQVAETTNAQQIDTLASTYERMASSVDMTVDQLKAYRNTLIETGEITEKASLDDVRAMARAERGAKKAKESLDKYIKSIQKAKTINSDYSNTLEQIRDIYADVFDLDKDGANKLSNEFLESAKNAQLLQEAIKGSEKSLNSLQKNAAIDLFKDAGADYTRLQSELDGLAEQISAYNFEENGIEIGTSIDTAPFYSAIDSMILSSYDAAKAISDGLSTMGVEATIQRHSVPIDGIEAQITPEGAIQVPQVGKDGSITWVTAAPSGSYSINSDTGEAEWYTLEGAKYKGPGVTRGGGGGSGGGGGGGGKKKQKKEHKRPQDEKERYHRNNSAITQIANELKKLTAIKDSAYGKNYVDAIDAETAALRREREEQEKLRQEALNYVKTDAADLIAAGAQIGENGVIENYDALMQQWINEYNAAVDAWNNSEQEESDQEDFDKANQLYEDHIQLIQDYEEALDVAAEAEARLQQILNEISENTLEGITYTLELELEVNERDLELLEYYREQYEETLQDQDNLFANLIQQAGEYETNFASLQAAYNDLMAEYNNGNGSLQADEYAEGLTDLHSQILENLQNLQDIKEQIAEVYANALDLAAEEIENATDALDHMNETMEAYIAIMGLAGRETDYATMQAFYDAQFATNMSNIEVQMAYLAALREQEEYFREKIEQDGELTELEEEQYRALMEQIRETESAVLDSTQTTLEVLQTGYENTINRIAQDLDEFMAGAAGSISHLQEQYAYFQEEQGRYVSTAKELYEVSSLNREIENTLAETTSAASKEALKALQEKINKQSELNEMTEYDIEMNQLQYQLLLARIQLEEAQNSKDTVRLTRDDNGNYAYQYTANEDKISEAMQNYEDTLQQMNDLTVERTSEIEQQMINSMAEYKEKIQEIAMDTTLSESEKYNRLLELQSQFDAEMAYLQEQAGIANENLLANQEAIADHYGVNITAITSSAAGNVNQTVQDMIANAQQYSTAMHDALFGPDGVSQSWSDYLAAVTTVQQASGTTVDDMLNNTANVGEVNEDAVQSALDAVEALTGTLEPINQMTEAWNAHQEALQGTIDTYEDLLVHINDLMTTLGQTDIDANLNPEGTNTDADTQNNDGKDKKKPQYGKNYFDEITANSIEEAVAEAHADVLAEQMNHLVDHYLEVHEEVAKNDELTEWERYKQLEELQRNYEEEMEILRNNYKKQQGEYEEVLTDSGDAYNAWLDYIDTLTHINMLNNYHAPGLNNEAPVVIDQNVTIEAEFPNVSNTDEIIEAFNELINRAAQFASAKK